MISNYNVQRLFRNTEISIMKLDNTMRLLEGDDNVAWEEKIVSHEEIESVVNEGFGKRAAKVFLDLSSSHVFFILQRMYPELNDWEWTDWEELLNLVLSKDNSYSDTDIDNHFNNGGLL